METTILNYRIIIKSTKQDGKTIYIAECPTLGVYDWGTTVEAVLESIKEGIACEIEGLAKDGETILLDHVEEEFVTAANITLPFSMPPLVLS